jgi:DNA topoisomerase IB
LGVLSDRSSHEFGLTELAKKSKLNIKICWFVGAFLGANDRRVSVHPRRRAFGTSRLCHQDFRTWAGTLSAARLLSELEAVTQAKLAAAVKDVAKQLGNTPTVCKNCYIHPFVLSSAQQHKLRQAMRPTKRKTKSQGLRQDEKALLQLLRNT